MTKSLTFFEVLTLINKTIEDFPHDECKTCECFLGYVTQLGIDSDESSIPLLDGYKPRREKIHSCLGCDPCPPGDRYGQYLRENRDEC